MEEGSKAKAHGKIFYPRQRSARVCEAVMTHLNKETIGARNIVSNEQLDNEEPKEVLDYETLRERNIQEKLKMLKSLNIPMFKPKSPVKRVKIFKLKSSDDIPCRPYSRRIRHLPPEIVLNENEESNRLPQRKRILKSNFNEINGLRGLAMYDHMLGGYVSKINKRIQLSLYPIPKTEGMKVGESETSPGSVFR